MHKQIGRLVFGVLAIGASVMAGQASAAALTAASFTFQLGTLPAASFPGVGATGTATSALSASLGAGTVFNGTFSTPIPSTAAPPITGIKVIITKNAGQTFTGSTPNNVGGNLSIGGLANVYGFGAYPSGAALLAIPLNVGTPNTVSSSAFGVNITAIGAGWTAGTAVVTGVTTTTTPSFQTNPAGSETAMGANALTPGGAGTLVLVTPIKIITGIAGNLAAFGYLSLTYVPEPGTLLLLGAGIAGLAALGRRHL